MSQVQIRKYIILKINNEMKKSLQLQPRILKWITTNGIRATKNCLTAKFRRSFARISRQDCFCRNPRRSFRIRKDNTELRGLLCGARTEFHKLEKFSRIQNKRIFEHEDEIADLKKRCSTASTESSSVRLVMVSWNMPL
jgi:hypothetical protein